MELTNSEILRREINPLCTQRLTYCGREAIRNVLVISTRMSLRFFSFDKVRVILATVKKASALSSNFRDKILIGRFWGFLALHSVHTRAVT